MCQPKAPLVLDEWALMPVLTLLLFILFNKRGEHCKKIILQPRP
jgi:hypothetical protein